MISVPTGLRIVVAPAPVDGRKGMDSLAAVVQQALRDNALTVRLEVEFDIAWERVQGGDRPLAADPDEFRALFDRRKGLYESAADATARSRARHMQG